MSRQRKLTERTELRLGRSERTSRSKPSRNESSPKSSSPVSARGCEQLFVGLQRSPRIRDCTETLATATCHEQPAASTTRARAFAFPGSGLGRRFVGFDRCDHVLDQPGDRLRRAVAVELPGPDEPFVRRQVPQHVDARPPPSPVAHADHLGAAVATDSRNAARRRGSAASNVGSSGGGTIGLLHRERMQRREHARRDRREIVERHAVVRDAGLFLESLHHRIAQVPLGREVPVHRAFTDAGPRWPRRETSRPASPSSATRARAPSPRSRCDHACRQPAGGGPDCHSAAAPSCPSTVPPEMKLNRRHWRACDARV